MNDLSIGLLIVELDILISAYQKTGIKLEDDSTTYIFDDKGADILRLLNLVTSELVKRIGFPF